MTRPAAPNYKVATGRAPTVVRKTGGITNNKTECGEWTQMSEETTDLGRTQDDEWEGARIIRPAGDTAKVRNCMACGEPFESEGWHNRMCRRCRKRTYYDG